MTAGVTCGSCGTALRATAKFCDECGKPLTACADTAEFKQVTVLFADVVRSMDIAAAVGAERMREIMTDLVGRGAAVVQRFGGTMEQFTGDGLMALFGAPMALEDHAIRACLAALEIQAEAVHVAEEVKRRDKLSLRLRVGLNSGRVVAGELGSGASGYAAAIGETVGYAQRMESVAPHGGVMLSEATAQLVEHVATLEDTEMVQIKGADRPVPVRQLVAIGRRDGMLQRAETAMVGRRWELAALDAIVERAIGGRGGVVNIVGPPGIGKSRVAREATALAADRGVEVFWIFCDSHACDVPFHAMTQLLRARAGVTELNGEAARGRIRERLPHAEAYDLLLLNDLLGIGDPEVPLPLIDPDARQRRLTALINTAMQERTQPAMFVIEDVQWIDAMSESMLRDLMTVIPRGNSVVLVTSRPEYDGLLTRIRGAQSIALTPLENSDIASLLGELLGEHGSVRELAATIIERAAGNPFFAEEIVRGLVQRGVLTGQRGSFSCRSTAADVAVPGTVEAAIEARIDRLSRAAKHAVTAASVIGARFGAHLLATLDIESGVDELVGAELIEQVRFTPHAEYAFRHPLIQTVAYESQLKSERTKWHRRVAAAIESAEKDSADKNAALIAEHLEAAGDSVMAYSWHMRAAAWSINRSIGAARVGWVRACRIADRLPADDPNQLGMRIAPRTMLCVTDFQGRALHGSRDRFTVLRELCMAADDKVSLAIGMTGRVIELMYCGSTLEASRLASEQMALLESIGDPNPTMALAAIAFCSWYGDGDFGEISRWSQIVIDLADGDPAKGAGFGVGSPLAIGLVFRGVAGWWFGRNGWRKDLDDAVAMARCSNPTTLAGVLTWTYSLAIYNGVLRADDSAVHALEEAVQNAEATSDDASLALIKYTLGVALLSRDADTDRDRGLKLLEWTRDWYIREQFLSMLPIAELLVARETARRGDPNGAITVMRSVVDDLHKDGHIGWIDWGTSVLTEALVERGGAADLAEAEVAIDRLANLGAENTGIREVTLLRLRAWLAHARGEDAVYRDLADRYRAKAEVLGYEGHTVWAAAMAEAVHE